MTHKSEIFDQKFAHFGGFRAPILTVMGQKNRFLDFFKVFKELFCKCLGIDFDNKRPSFFCILSSNGR